MHNHLSQEIALIQKDSKTSLQAWEPPWIVGARHPQGSLGPGETVFTFAKVRVRTHISKE